MQNKNIVILGGGIGGIVAANKLAKLLPQGIEIVLVERNKLHSFPASYLWLMVNKRKPSQIITSLNKIVDKRVKILYEEVKRIDTAAKTITTENEKINYDYLIVALGTELDKKYLERHDEDIHNFYTYEGAQKLKDELIKINEGEIIIAVESLPYKCPGAPFEAAMLIADFINKHGLKNKININLYTPEPSPLPVAGPDLGKSIADLLESKKINFFPLHQLKEVNSGGKTITFDSDLTRHYDLLIVIPKHNPPGVISNSGLADNSGWIPVDKNTLITKDENIFAIGDITTIPIPGRWQPDKPMKLSKAGVFAHAQALTVSDIIACKILGKESKEIFCGDGFCMLEAGEDFAGFAYGDFLASPHPDVKMKKLGRIWHLGKVLFEKWWLAPVGLIKSIYKYMLTLGGKMFGIPIKL